MTDGLRIDRWLWHARFYKSRSLAAEAVAGGKVHVNGERVKRAKTLRLGDVLTVSRGGLVYECRVLRLPERRGPASEAQLAYEESPQSRERRERHLEQLKLAAAYAPRPDARPDKHDRRELRRIRGRD
jgi:ribosome-associated heat shock protein Hsp15